MLSWEYPPRIVGGISRHVEGLSKALVEDGNEVHVVTLDFPNTPLYEQADDIHIHRVPVEIAAPSFHTWVLLFNHFFEKKIGQIAHRFGSPDIVHIHDWLTVPAGVAAKHLLRKPLVMTFHSTEAMRSHGTRSSESDVVSGLEWWGAYESAYIVTVSNSMKRHLTSIFGLPPSKIEVIYNAIDISKFQSDVDRDAVRRRLDIDLDEKLVTAVGRLTWQKGFDNLVKAFPKILKKEPNAKLVIVGDGYMRGELEELTRKNGVSGRVILKGFVDDSELVQVMKSSDVVVVSSRFEPFGIVALETMAAGVPVAASGVDGLLEIVEHEKNGLLFDPNNIDDIAKAVVRILADRTLAERLSANAGEKVKMFNWGDMAEKTMQVYCKAAEDARFE